MLYNGKAVNQLINEIKKMDLILDKSVVEKEIIKTFNLITDRKVFYNKDFAIRFSQSKTKNFGNTVLSLSALQKFDSKPFFVCLVTPKKNYIFMANTTLLSKISHSSHQLRVDNIRGSFNGSDIIREIEGIKNIPENFELLFSLHEAFSFEENLERLVEATNNIEGRDLRYKRTHLKDAMVLNSPERTLNFLNSNNYKELNNDLNDRVNKVINEIVIASLIPNVNIRGRIIEYLITHGESDGIKNEIVRALNNKEPLPSIMTDDDLGDYSFNFDNHITKTDIKTKVMYLNSAPKAFNIDKLLEFLSNDKTIYMIFLIGVTEDEDVLTHLCTIFDNQLLSGTIIQFHWAGRNSRGVAQYNGSVLDSVIKSRSNEINIDSAKVWLQKLIES